MAYLIVKGFWVLLGHNFVIHYDDIAFCSGDVFMPKKIQALADYIGASEAADILSRKLGRPIDPHYIHKIRGIRSEIVNATSKLYNRYDIESVNIRQRRNESS